MVHGRTGLIPNRNREEDYADALLGLIERPAERARIGRAAREASLGFTWEADCHLYYRRSRHLAVAAGAPRVWKARLVERLQRRAA